MRPLSRRLATGRVDQLSPASPETYTYTYGSWVKVQESVTAM